MFLSFLYINIKHKFYYSDYLSVVLYNTFKLCNDMLHLASCNFQHIQYTNKIIAPTGLKCTRM